ncbi:MAG: hypothetical protein RLY14_879 [Planctomycetota bacterium]|jgi:hypothetical protein
MTNCTETARTPDEQQLVDVASILDAGILRLRERQAQFSVMSWTNVAGFDSHAASEPSLKLLICILKSSGGARKKVL